MYGLANEQRSQDISRRRDGPTDAAVCGIASGRLAAVARASGDRDRTECRSASRFIRSRFYPLTIDIAGREVFLASDKTGDGAGKCVRQPVSRHGRTPHLLLVKHNSMPERQSEIE